MIPCKEHIQLLQYWIKRLGLQDWSIDLQDNCSPREMYDADNQGETSYNYTYKKAIIKIASEQDRQHDVMPLDYEHILVHELLHCKFAILDDSGNSLQDKVVHQLVEEFASILLEGRK